MPTPHDPAAGDPPADAPTLPPGITAAEWERHTQRQAALSAAASDPLPGPLALAFARPPTAIAGLTVRPVVHADFVVLKKLGSPILASLTGGRIKRRPTDALTDDSTYELIYQFTRPCAEVERQVDTLGVKKFRELARQTIGYTLGPVPVLLLSQAIEREFGAAFSTVITHDPKPDADGSFPSPPASETGSAGG